MNNNYFVPKIDYYNDRISYNIFYIILLDYLYKMM